MSVKDIVCMIPARIGSERFKRKNLILVNNKPIISYVIEIAKKTNKFKNIYLNSDDKIFKKIAEKNKINFYFRKKKYATSNTKSDSVVYDFIKNINCKYINNYPKNFFIKWNWYNWIIKNYKKTIYPSVCCVISFMKLNCIIQSTSTNY